MATKNFRSLSALLRKYRSIMSNHISVKSNPQVFKWALLGVFMAGASYWGVKRYRLAYCQEKGTCTQIDPLDAIFDKLNLKDKLDDLGQDIWQQVQDKFIDEHVKEALDFIVSICDRLKQFDMPDIEYKIPRFILLFLVKRSQEFTIEKRRNECQSADLNRDIFEEDKKMGQFALNVYAASWAWKSDHKDAAIKMGLKESDKVLKTWFTDQDGFCPKFMIFTDHDSRSIVLAIRGTYSLADVIVDVICDEEEFLDGFAHRGILRGAKKILEESQDTLKETFETYPDYRLVVTGHSLGAGTAILIAMKILSGEFKDLFKVSNVKCVALAPPPVYRSRSVDKYSQNIDIFINGNDCVPRLTLANMAKLMSMLRAVDQVPLSVQDHLKIIAGVDDPEVSKNLEKLSQALSQADQDQFPKLEHPGKIFYLHKEAPKKFKILTSPGKYFSENLLFFENMVLDHLQPYYEEAFANVQWD